MGITETKDQDSDVMFSVRYKLKFWRPRVHAEVLPKWLRLSVRPHRTRETLNGF